MVFFCLHVSGGDDTKTVDQELLCGSCLKILIDSLNNDIQAFLRYSNNTIQN